MVCIQTVFVSQNIYLACFLVFIIIVYFPHNMVSLRQSLQFLEKLHSFICVFVSYRITTSSLALCLGLKVCIFNILSSCFDAFTERILSTCSNLAQIRTDILVFPLTADWTYKHTLSDLLKWRFCHGSRSTVRWLVVKRLHEQIMSHIFVLQSVTNIMSGSCQLDLSGSQLAMTTWSRPTTVSLELKESPSTLTMGQFRWFCSTSHHCFLCVIVIYI